MSVFANLKNSLPPLIPDPYAGLGNQPSGSLTMPDDSGAPQAALQKVSASSPKPTVVFAPTPQGEEQQHIQGNLEKDYQKDLHPWGSPGNHPGVFGKIMHGLNVATGGVNRRGWEEQGLEKRLNDVMGQESTNDYRNAETGHTKEETNEMPGRTQSEEALQGAQTDEARQRVAQGPDLAQAYAHRVNQVLATGGDPSTDPVAQHLADAITGIQKQATPPPGTKVISREVGGKSHNVLIDERTGNDIRDEGETGEKPPTVRVETPGEERGAKNDLLKAYQPTLDSAERMNVMTDAYEKAVKNHDQQAMLNLLANHLGMTMGLQKGARMTRDIIREAQQSTPWLQGMAAKFDKDGYLTGVTLTPQQMRQMVSLGQERYVEDARKSRSTAQYLGAKDDGPERVPGPSTINYYLGLANGDAAKAKKMASDDGWTVK